MEFIFFSILIGICVGSLVAARIRSFKQKCAEEAEAMNTDELMHQINTLYDELDEEYSFRKSCMYEALWEEHRKRFNTSTKD